MSKASEVPGLARLIANEVRTIPKASEKTGAVKQRLFPIQVVHELTIRPNKGVDTRWLSSYDTACDVQKVLQELVELKRDREFSCRMGPALGGAITKLNGLRNELNDCIEFLSMFKKPIERLQVCFLTSFLKSTACLCRAKLCLPSIWSGMQHSGS